MVTKTGLARPFWHAYSGLLALIKGTKMHKSAMNNGSAFQFIAAQIGCLKIFIKLL